MIQEKGAGDQTRTCRRIRRWGASRWCCWRAVEVIWRANGTIQLGGFGEWNSRDTGIKRTVCESTPGQGKVLGSDFVCATFGFEEQEIPGVVLAGRMLMKVGLGRRIFVARRFVGLVVHLGCAGECLLEELEVTRRLEDRTKIERSPWDKMCCGTKRKERSKGTRRGT